MVDDQILHIQIWDTAGPDKFKSLTRIVFKNTHCVFLIYDVTKEIPLQNVEHWLKETNERLSDFERYNIAPN
jgi:GTPase SAR1 family protein